MINDRRRYDLDEYKKDLSRKSGRTDRIVKRLQKLFFGLLVTSLVLALVLLGAFIGKWNKEDTSPSEKVGKVTEATSKFSLTVPDLTTESETEETEPPYTVTESLPANTICDNYFGPLVPAENAVPYEHFEVRGLYLNAAMNLDANIELCKNSELNTVVIDLKESDGVYFKSTNAIAQSVGPDYLKGFLDLTSVCAKCHENGVRVIGRIVVFKDPMLVEKYPEHAICDVYKNPLKYSIEGGKSFANPYDQWIWDYNIDLAIEAIGMGVDEIQFDYVRFPTGSSTSGEKPYFGIEGEVPSKSDAINRFLQTARIRIQDELGVPLGADIFGIAVTSSLDGDLLGQDWATLGFTGVDSLCPMIYPSHYALGTVMNGVKYDTPDKNPYEIMYNALTIGSANHDREGYSTVRPYLQAFTASYIGAGNYMEYDYDAINAQIRAVQDAGLSEFILWNAACVYPSGNYSGNNG